MTSRRSRGSVIAFVALATVGATPVSTRSSTPRSEAGDGWALGFAVQVARTCPVWEVERQEILAARGVLPGQRPGGRLLGFDGPFQREYYRGQDDAQAALRRRADFCDRVRAIAGGNWPRLARVLKPRSEGAGAPHGTGP